MSLITAAPQAGSELAAAAHRITRSVAERVGKLHRPLVWAMQIGLAGVAVKLARDELHRVRLQGVRGWLRLSTRELVFSTASVVALAFVDVAVVTVAYLQRRRRLAPTRYFASDDFAILVPVFGDISYFRNAEALSRYGGRVCVCTTTRESREFENELAALKQRFGFTVLREDLAVPRRRSAKTRPSASTGAGGNGRRDEIIRRAVRQQSASTVVFMDGDTYPTEAIERVVGSFEFCKLDVASVRVVPSSVATLAERFQALEYEIAMTARYLFPWLTSGAATIARTTAASEIMQHHSLFFSGGDIEVGILARMLNMRIDHLPFTFVTDVPASMRELFRQRTRGWFIGGFRIGVVNADRPGLGCPSFVLYNSFVVYGLFLARWVVCLSHPWSLALTMVLYVVSMTLAMRRRFRPWMICFTVYALVNSMVGLPIGAAYYVSCRIRGFDGGRITTSRINPDGRDLHACTMPETSVWLNERLPRATLAQPLHPRPTGRPVRTPLQRAVRTARVLAAIDLRSVAIVVVGPGDQAGAVAELLASKGFAVTTHESPPALTDGCVVTLTVGWPAVAGDDPAAWLIAVNVCDELRADPALGSVVTVARAAGGIVLDAVHANHIDGVDVAAALLASTIAGSRPGELIDESAGSLLAR